VYQSGVLLMPVGMLAKKRAWRCRSGTLGTPVDPVEAPVEVNPRRRMLRVMVAMTKKWLDGWLVICAIIYRILSVLDYL